MFSRPYTINVSGVHGHKAERPLHNHTFQLAEFDSLERVSTLGFS